MKSGIYINLDASDDRRNALLEALALSGFNPSSYCRFSAIRPQKETTKDLRGLNSLGELGIWMSLVGVFRMISTDPFSDVVHVLEDDMTFAEPAANTVQAISGLMTSHESFQAVDIVFLDYFMNTDLCRRVISRKPSCVPAHSLQFLDARRFYLASISSFLVRRSSAAYLSVLLGRIFKSAQSLMSIDITLRSLLQLGALKGALLSPPIGAPAWELDGTSTIQEETFPEVRKSQKAYILLRQLAAGIRSPYWCAENLAQLYAQKNPVLQAGSPDDFLAYFVSLEPKMTLF